MAQSVLLNESEISIYRNALINYADFLSRKFATFSETISDLQETGFIDELVRAELSDLVNDLRPLLSEMEQVIGEDLKTSVTRTFSEISAADTFNYPASILEAVKDILRAFV